MTTADFSFENVSKSFGKKDVLKGISFCVHPNEVVGLIGKSGCGKTVLLNILIGNMDFDSGSVCIRNTHIKKITSKLKSTFGFSEQHNSFYEELTLKENLDYFGSLYGLDQKEITKRTKVLFELIDLELDMHTVAKNLSGGMKKRFDFCCALLHDPDVLILDEPTTGLDPLRRIQILDVIKRIKDSGTTIIVSSHFLDEIEYLCDRVLVLDKGKLIEDSNPMKLIRDYGDNDRIVLKTHPGHYKKLIDNLNHVHLMHSYVVGDSVVILTPKSEVVLKYVLNRIKQLKEKLVNVEVQKPNLEKVFQGGFKKQNDALHKSLLRLKTSINSMVKHKYNYQKIKSVFVDHGWPEDMIEVLIEKAKENE